MLTPAPFFSLTVAVPTLCPFASFNSTTTGLLAAYRATAPKRPASATVMVRLPMGYFLLKRSSHEKRNLLFCIALGLLLAGSTAQAAFVTFVINPANLNERALVGEQIYVVPGGYDYEFLVANTGTVGINGFYGGIGNFAVAVAGGQWGGTAAGGADPPRFPASVIGGAFRPLLTGEPGDMNPYSVEPCN